MSTTLPITGRTIATRVIGTPVQFSELNFMEVYLIPTSNGWMPRRYMGAIQRAPSFQKMFRFGDSDLLNGTEKVYQPTTHDFL